MPAKNYTDSSSIVNSLLVYLTVLFILTGYPMSLSAAKPGSDCTASGKATSSSNRSCNSADNGPDGTVSTPLVPTVNLSASPLNVEYNGSTKLSWTSSNTDSCIASGSWSGSQGTSGTRKKKNLTTGKTYTLTCSGEGGTASDSINVTVAAAASPVPTVNLSASPTNLPYDGSTTLTWSSDNASDCTASGDWSGSKATAGSQTISALTTNRNFSLSCSGAGGSANDSVNITVAAAPIPAPTLSFSASPATVSQNGSSTLSWNVTDATSCTASGDWSGDKNTTGSETTSSIVLDSQFTLTCSGAGGTVTDAVNITVVQSNNGTALLTWTPPTENTDNSALTDLAGYKIYFGTSPGSYNDAITINNPGLSSYLVENLASSDWYFAMTAVNLSGIESTYSIEVYKSIE